MGYKPMKALRIILSQNMANYKKEEAVDNKMTYALPPMSTVIGALYSACGYTREQHPEKIDIKVGIQGNYGSMQREVYQDHAFLNSVMNDRGILVKIKNSQLLSNAYEVVAKSKASQGNDFENEVTIDVVNRELLEEYKGLRAQRRLLDQKKKEEIDPKVKEYAAQIKQSKSQLKILDKGSEEAKELKQSIESLMQSKQEVEAQFSRERDTADQKYGLFASLTTSIKSYEVLYDVQLVLHILSDEKTMEDIRMNAYNIKSIGRSEDFVDVHSVEYVELCEQVSEEVQSHNSAYLPYYAVKNLDVMVRDKAKGGSAQGTKYYMNKIDTIEQEKRVFQKEWVLYAGKYSIDEVSNMGPDTGIFYDGEYIVAFI